MVEINHSSVLVKRVSRDRMHWHDIVKGTSSPCLPFRMLITGAFVLARSQSQKPREQSKIRWNNTEGGIVHWPERPGKECECGKFGVYICICPRRRCYSSQEGDDIDTLFMFLVFWFIGNNVEILGWVVYVMLGIQFAMNPIIRVQSISSACDLCIPFSAMLRILIWQNLTSLLFILITPNLWKIETLLVLHT